MTTSTVSIPKSNPKTFWLVLGVFLLLVAGFIWLWFGGRGVGAECTLDDECNSHKCLKTRFPGELVTPRKGVCTEFCRSDADCPSDMHCGVATRGPKRSIMEPDNQRQVCLPRL